MTISPLQNVATWLGCSRLQPLACHSRTALYVWFVAATLSACGGGGSEPASTASAVPATVTAPSTTPVTTPITTPITTSVTTPITTPTPTPVTTPDTTPTTPPTPGVATAPATATAGGASTPLACEKTNAKVGQVATLSTRSHGVSGKVVVIDNCTLEIRNFNYDGGGLSRVFVYGGKAGNYAAGFPVGNNLRGTQFVNQTVTITLSAGDLDKMDGVSIWCSDANANFGDGVFTAPSP